MTLIYILTAILLLLLNAFFVLAEFASVKVRPTQMEALAEKGNRRAKKVQYIQTHLDKYLSVCQIGITLASIGLGFVGEPAIANILNPIIEKLGLGSANDVTVHGVSLAIAYVLISFLHIVIGELVPKSIAIRKTEKMALFTAFPINIFYYIFIIPLWVLNTTSNAILFLFRISPVKGHEDHSEDEVRIILDQAQSTGMMSFRRLLYIENILDMGSLTVRNAMQVKEKTQCLCVGMSRQQIDEKVAKYRYSRYPFVSDDGNNPLGFIHIKDLYLAEHLGKSTESIREFVRPCLKVNESTMLESLLPRMQGKGQHLALVVDENDKWTGIITIEDLLEEVVGTIEEEYPVEPIVKLTVALSSPDQVVLDVEGSSIVAATYNALSRLSPNNLPLSMSEIMPHIVERERAGSSYVGRQLAIPHARFKSISRPTVVVARLKKPIPAPATFRNDTINYLFILLTPANSPRLHQILLAHIARLFESSFFEARLEDATTAQELYDAICAVEQTTDMTV